MFRAVACTRILLPCLLPARRLALAGDARGALRLRHMAAEVPRGRELAQLVPDHVLGDVDRHVLLAVVDRERQDDHLWHHGRGARPGLDHTLLAAARDRVDLLDQALVDVWSLLRR